MIAFAAICIVLCAAGYIIYRVIIDRREDASMTWEVPIALLDALLPQAEARMVQDGYAKGDYRPVIKDCSQFSAHWMKVLDDLLKPHRPEGEKEWKKQYSFPRDPTATGANPGRHRVVAIKTTAGMKYIDTYRINGMLYRPLSKTEQTRGYYL
jgi:hypothetical protein